MNTNDNNNNNNNNNNEFPIDINESFDADKYTDPSTPDLSFPDSFDDNYDHIINNNINYSDSQGNNNTMIIFFKVHHHHYYYYYYYYYFLAQQEIYNLKLKNVTILGELENVKNISIINDNNSKKVLLLLLLLLLLFHYNKHYNI